MFAMRMFSPLILIFKTICHCYKVEKDVCLVNFIRNYKSHTLSQQQIVESVNTVETEVET